MIASGLARQLMVNIDKVLKQFRKACLAFPDTVETITWGSPHFRVANKIFCGFGKEKLDPSK